MDRLRFQPSAPFLVALAVLLALLHALLAVTASAGKSITSDEIAHFTAGHAYNSLNDYRLHPENGNLPQRLAALPMLLAGDPLPPREGEFWNTANVWRYGHTFFFERGLSTDERVFQGRAVIALVSAFTGLIVFFWTRALFGWRGAFLALGLYAFCPTFLAHGALATSDLVMTTCFLAALGAYWRHLQVPGWRWGALSCLATGLAFVAKFSAVLLPPMLALTASVWLASGSPALAWRVRARRLVRSTAAHIAAAWLIIWAFYDFRYSAFAFGSSPEATFNHGWGFVLSNLGAKARVLWQINEWRLFPEAWLYGFTYVLSFSQARGAFMSGDYGVTGWVSFFPWAFLIKTPPPLLLLLGGGLFAAGRRAVALGLRPALRRLVPLTPLAALFVVYWATSLASHLNIGHRHILPVYPVLFIAAGWLGRRLDFRQPVAAACIAGALLWQVAESVRTRPHHLAYFNALVGGSDQGWRHLVDSSLDWGQDLPSLKTWLDRHARGEKVFHSYFGTGSAAYEGIRAIELPRMPDFHFPHPWHALDAGVYAVSASMLQQVYGNYRGPWTIENENQFQSLRKLEPTLLSYFWNPAQRPTLDRERPPDQWIALWKTYEALRFARLCHYLRVRRPDAIVAHTVLVHRLTAAEVVAATGAGVREWQTAIEQAVTARR